jgi:ComF family protein
VSAALRPLLGDLVAGFADLVFAPVCVACRRSLSAADPERMVCGSCWSRCRGVPAPRCPRCWGPVVPTDPTGPTCRGCRDWPAALRCVRSAFLMDAVPRSIVHALKYGGWRDVAAAMAARMAAVALPRDVEDEARLVVAVPTTATRRRERGYNQAEALAAAYARATGRRPAPELLARAGAGRSQTTLHRVERRANVAGAFSVPGGGAARLRGEHVLLVDDVWTTGATAAACVHALLEGGARVVSVATFARVIPELEP